MSVVEITSEQYADLLQQKSDRLRYYPGKTLDAAPLPPDHGFDVTFNDQPDTIYRVVDRK